MVSNAANGIAAPDIQGINAGKKELSQANDLRKRRSGK